MFKVLVLKEKTLFSFFVKQFYQSIRLLLECSEKRLVELLITVSCWSFKKPSIKKKAFNEGHLDVSVC